MNDKVIFSYAKLWKLMIDRNINKTQLKDKAQISTNAVAKMGRNEAVSMETLGKICCVLGCEIGDIVEISEAQHETSSI
jgi:DNA (cytosine-5)-methyltransferase 1